MNVQQFREKCKNNIIHNRTTYERADLPSATDPTQACPVQKIYNAMINGTPLDVSQQNVVFNNLSVDNLSTIEKRHTDKFDKFIEFNKSAKKISRVSKLVDKSKQDITPEE